MKFPLLKWQCRLITVLLVISGGMVRAETALIAVASNFAEPLREIAERFAANSDHELRISAGSSGHLYAQIVNGAPYDLFLSADSLRPLLLEEAALIEPGTRFTYAIGQLVFWARADTMRAESCGAELLDPGKRRLAIANPALAPYGAAAKQVLEERGLWESVQGNLVVGQNVSQVLHFAYTGNVDMALLAQSQFLAFDGLATGCAMSIRDSEHDSILQQAVLLARGTDNAAAQAFIAYLRGPEASEVIKRFGYRVSRPPCEEDS